MTTPRTPFAWANNKELDFVSIQLLVELERLSPKTRFTTQQAVDKILSHGFSTQDGLLIFQHWRNKTQERLSDSELDAIWHEIATPDPAKTPPPKPRLRMVTAAELVNMALPPRENLLAPWLPMQGLAMVYAPRGIGKTFFGLNVAYAVASGGSFLSWQASAPYPVLYIDGEMPATTMQERLTAIIQTHSIKANEDAIGIITPDLQDGNPMPDLGTKEGQGEIEPFLEGVKLIIIDNISTLCRSGRENESEGWIIVQEWALRQRSAGRSVLFIHHAGKGGNQRGTSKREDVLDTVISLKRPTDYSPTDGASFEVHFEKARGFSGADAEPLVCKLVSDEFNRLTWAYSALESSTFDKVVSLANEGLSQSEIASELEINKSNVSRHLSRAREQGLLKGDSPKNKSKPVNSANYRQHKEGE